MAKQNGSFRAKRVKFAQIANTALQDKDLSLKAKGLYSLIQSLITIPGIDLRLWKLRSMCSEGDKAWDSAWKELKCAGYLKQYRIPNGLLQNGEHGYKYEYDLLDSPDPKTPAVINLNKDGKAIAPKNKESCHTPQNGGGGEAAVPDQQAPSADHTPRNGGSGKTVRADHTPHFGPGAKSTVCLKHPVENGGGNSNTRYSNTRYSNTLLCNTMVGNTPSVSHSETDTGGQTDDIRQELINRIDFDWIADAHPDDADAAGALLNCMVEMLTESSTKIGRTEQSRYALQKQLAHVDEEDIVNFLAHMRERGTQPKNIRNVKAYWKSSFVNYLSEEALAAAIL